MEIIRKRWLLCLPILMVVSLALAKPPIYELQISVQSLRGERIDLTQLIEEIPLTEQDIVIEQPKFQVEKTEYLELKEFSEHFHYGNGSVHFSSRLGDQNVWNGSHYNYYLFDDTEKSVRYANSKITFYDWYALVEQNGTTVIDDTRWIVEYWKIQGESWNTLDLYNHVWFDPIITTKTITFIQGYDDGLNYMNVSYVVTNQASVKVNIDFLSGEERTLRFVWQLTGMGGDPEINMTRRDFIFNDIIISCNDTDPSVEISYDWTVANKKLDVMLGNYSVIDGSKVTIDPTFSEKQETDSRDWRARISNSVYTGYDANTLFTAGYFTSDAIWNSSVTWDSGITSTIASTSDAEMSLYACADSSLETDEYIGAGLYDKGDSDEYWSESEMMAAVQTAMEQTMYYSYDSFLTDIVIDTNHTITDGVMGDFIDQWVTHHNGDPTGRQYIPFKFYPGTNADPNTADMAHFSESTEIAAERPTLTFTYTLGGGNTAPSAVVDTAISSNLYAGKSFTYKTNHTDADGAADLAELFSGLGNTPYNVTFNSTAATGSLTVHTKNGSDYITSVSASGSSITNGYQVTWTVRLDWDFPFDDSSTIDTHARSKDDEPEYSSWDTHNTNADFENDLECQTFNVYIDGNAEYGGTNGEIEDTDWFRGGVQVTCNGTVEYEGSSQTFNSSYASAVEVELYYDSGATGQKDTVILSGVFEGITYTPTSASGLDTTAYFDVVLNSIPTGGSDVTGAGIEITSKRDNEDPTTTFHSITEDDPHTYIYATGQTIYFSDLMGGTDQLATIAVNASDGSGSGLYAVEMSAWDDEAVWNDTSYPYERQYSTDSSETSGSITFTAIDNVGNSDSTPETITMTEDTTAPTTTFHSITEDDPHTYIYATGQTIYFSDLMGGTDQLATIAVNASDGGAGVYAVEMSAWDDEAAWNDTSYPYERQYSTDSTETSGSITFTAIDNVGNTDSTPVTITMTEDTTGPTGSISPDADSASIGYAPNSNYDDDSTINFTTSGASDGGSGLPSTCYSYNGSDWTSSTTIGYGGQSDGNISLTVYIRDNVGNNGTDETWIVVDTDNPTGFTWTWTRVNDTYPCVQNSSGFYYDDTQNNYSTITINDDGTIQNSDFWKIEWDKNSILITGLNDTSGLPDSRDFNYWNDDNGTLIVRVINNAGNYQTFTIECYDSYESGDPPDTTTTTTTTTLAPGTYTYEWNPLPNDMWLINLSNNITLTLFRNTFILIGLIVIVIVVYRILYK